MMQNDSIQKATEQGSPVINNNIRDGLIVEIIGGVAVIVIAVFWKRISQGVMRFFKRVRYKTFQKIKIKYTLEELKRTLKIIVIDDDNIFPVDGFKEFGYSIESWSKLTVQKLRQLHKGEYDIIILDIYGVAKDLAEKDGLDVLLEIKTKNPAQVIIAYSGQSFDFSKNKFWELADEKLGKPTPFIGTQSIIDNLIEQTFTVTYHHEKIRDVLNQNKIGSQLNKVEDLFVRAKISNAEPNWIDQLQFLGIKHDEVMKINSILSKLFRLSILK